VALSCVSVASPADSSGGLAACHRPGPYTVHWTVTLHSCITLPDLEVRVSPYSLDRIFVGRTRTPWRRSAGPDRVDDPVDAAEVVVAADVVAPVGLADRLDVGHHPGPRDVDGHLLGVGDGVAVVEMSSSGAMPWSGRSGEASAAGCGPVGAAAPRGAGAQVRHCGTPCRWRSGGIRSSTRTRRRRRASARRAGPGRPAWERGCSSNASRFSNVTYRWPAASSCSRAFAPFSARSASPFAFDSRAYSSTSPTSATSISPTRSGCSRASSSR
jgi:hypothetical protein